MSVNYSMQRDIIYDYLITRTDHPTAENVYENVKERIPNISRATVYRNLNLLVELGKLRRLGTEDSKYHYDADMSPHYHFICNKCNGVSDVFMDFTKLLTEAALKEEPGIIESHEVFFYGICRKCKDKQE